jgi:hypothetical protein
MYKKYGDSIYFLKDLEKIFKILKSSRAAQGAGTRTIPRDDSFYSFFFSKARSFTFAGLNTPTTTGRHAGSSRFSLRENGTPSIDHVLQFFLYSICHNFRKIIGCTKILSKYTSGADSRHLEFLPLWATTLGESSTVGSTDRWGQVLGRDPRRKS